MLKYNITSDNPTSIDLPNEFRQSTLVIDTSTNTVIATIPIGQRL